MKYLLIVLLIFTSSCRHIVNSWNKIRGEDYSSFLNDDEIKQYDSLAKLVFYHPDSYQDSIENFNFVNNFELYSEPLDTLKKYNTNKIILCYDGIYLVKNRGKVIDTPYGYLVYKIENTDVKLKVGIRQQFNLDVSMSLEIRREKTCKFWKWDYY